MPTSVFLWLAAAVALFWGVGAYNRLVRLRTEVNTAFAVLHERLQDQVGLVRSMLPAAAGADAGPFAVEALPWSGLEGAAAQLATSLAAARTRPLDTGRIAALAAACDVMATAWSRVEREDAHDLAGPRLPVELLARQSQLVTHGQASAEQFSQQVARYNEAIAQFPALLLAWLFGFRPGRSL